MTKDRFSPAKGKFATLLMTGRQVPRRSEFFCPQQRKEDHDNCQSQKDDPVTATRRDKGLESMCLTISPP